MRGDFFDNLIANADDLGLSESVNAAILQCFEKKYINSVSFLTNTVHFKKTVDLIHKNPVIKNIGVHINLMEGLPVSNFDQFDFLDASGQWNGEKINNKLSFFNKKVSEAFVKEISMQIDKALSAKLYITHLDSHYHLHTLPCFFNIFVQVAKKYKLRLRLAQTYNEGNYVNYAYRLYINNIVKKNNINYTDYFVTVDYLIKKQAIYPNRLTEVMLHPDLDSNGNLIDHFDKLTMKKWSAFVK